MKKRIIAVLLSAMLLLGVLSVAAAAADRPFYLVLGDSIAYGSGLSNPKDAVYGKVVADTNGYEYANYAVPGHTTANLMKRMKNETVRAAIARADIISISIGGNNYILGNMPGLMADVLVRGDVSQFNRIDKAYYEDLCEIFAGIRALNPDAVILMQTLYNPQTGYVGEVYDYGCERINGSVRRYAETYPGEIEIVDVAAYLTDHSTDFASDRVHPSAAGNEKIARAVLEKLAELGLTDQTEPVIRTPGKDDRGVDFNWAEIYARILHALGALLRAVRGTAGSVNA
jgi:lysophospholipase L1-like esterase